VPPDRGRLSRPEVAVVRTRRPEADQGPGFSAGTNVMIVKYLAKNGDFFQKNTATHSKN
jgi:hypothetical protein